MDLSYKLANWRKILYNGIYGSPCHHPLILIKGIKNKQKGMYNGFFLCFHYTGLLMRKIQLFLLLTFIIVSSVMITPSHAAESSISWTEDELAFMEEHPVIRLGVDPKFVPFEFIDEDGEYKGIAADYLSLISERTGLKFEVAKGLTWPEVYDLALARELDALPTIAKTEEREKHFLFSKPYYYFKRAIVTRDTDTHISGIEDLEGLTVAVQRNSSHHSYLLSYPHINLSL